MDRIDHRSRRDAYGRRINRDHSSALAYSVPWISILLASLIPVFAIASAVPFVPPFGLMMLIAWRLVRPGLLPIWAGFPLGMVDDLFSGQPFGSAIFLWSVVMLAIEVIEARFPWRNFVQDWFIAANILTVYLVLAALLSGGMIGLASLAALGPQLLLSLLLMPIISRMVARLDRFRLLRIRIIG